MIKWPWKTNDAGRNMALPWDEALAIPVLANLLPEEQSKLIQLAERFYSKNGWYRYRASNWIRLKIRASPCSSACRCWSWVSNGWMASTKC